MSVFSQYVDTQAHYAISSHYNEKIGVHFSQPLFKPLSFRVLISKVE